MNNVIFTINYVKLPGVYVLTFVALGTGADSVAFLKETFVKEIELKNQNKEEAGVLRVLPSIVSGIVKNSERCRLNPMVIKFELIYTHPELSGLSEPL